MKIRVCLAIGNKDIEDWMQKNLSEYCEFVGVAIHREQILEMINKTMPDVLIFDVSLPSSSIKGISVDNLLMQIKTTYSGCRPILLCGDQVPGDEFLTRVVSRGVYDILCGNNLSIQDICDMIFTPKDYAYASKLQALDTIADKDMGVKQVRTEPEKKFSPVRDESGSKPSYMQSHSANGSQKIIKQASQTFSAPQNNDYQRGGAYSAPQNTYPTPQNNYPVPQNTYSAPQGYPAVEPENTQMLQQEEMSDTSVLTSDMINPAEGPKGIIFSPVESYSLVKSGAREVGFTNNGYRQDRVLKQVQQPIRYGKLIAFTSARQGVGCTSNAINTAFYLASTGKKVLLFDATFGRSGIYQRLCLPEQYGNTVEDILRAYINKQDISQMPLSKTQIKNSDGREKYLPDSLHFTRFRDEYRPEDGLIGFDGLLDGLLQYYDYILADTSLSYPEASVLTEIMKKASKVVLVTLQDIYEVNTACQSVSVFDRAVQISGKLVVLVNRHIKKGSPQAEMISGALGALGYITVADDGYGYMRAYSAGRAYYPYAKRKIQEVYGFLTGLF